MSTTRRRTTSKFIYNAAFRCQSFLGGEERWKTIYKLPVDTLKEKKKNKKLKSAAPLPFLFFFHVVVCRHLKNNSNNHEWFSG